MTPTSMAMASRMNLILTLMEMVRLIPRIKTSTGMVSGTKMIRISTETVRPTELILTPMAMMARQMRKTTRPEARSKNA